MSDSLLYVVYEERHGYDPRPVAYRTSEAEARALVDALLADYENVMRTAEPVQQQWAKFFTAAIRPGPGYVNDMYPHGHPLRDALEKMKPLFVAAMNHAYDKALDQALWDTRVSNRVFDAPVYGIWVVGDDPNWDRATPGPTRMTT